MKKEHILNFHLFDGEGGEGAGATASQSAQEQDTKVVEYGKSRGESQTPGQVGSDNGAQARDLNAEFAEMIGKGGEYHDIYGQHVSQAIQNRFKNQQDLQGKIDGITQGLSTLFTNYGLPLGDFEGLSNAISKDDRWLEAGAEAAGMEVEQYKQFMQLKADSERLKQYQAEYQQEQQRQAMYRAWEEQAGQLQQTFPNFDLAMEIQTNEQFVHYLDMGATVNEAFMMAHMNEIMSGNNAQVQRAAMQNVVNTIQQRASRPAEGAMSHAPAIERKSDPSSLTNADLDEINRRVEQGEMFAF